MLKIQELSKSYGNKKVLKGINVEFSKAKVYGIVGENGAGKTTLFRCIAGLEDYEGSIQASHEPLKNYLGFLPTDPVFLSRVTGWEYLKLLCISRDITTEDFEAQNIFDLPLNQYAETYSTGMKKKLALMAVLLQDNEVLILDEPFNGVDIHSNMIITEIIKKLKSLDKVILISSHIFASLSEICDEILLLKEGRFEKEVSKDKFHELDQKMKEVALGDSINKLRLK